MFYSTCTSFGYWYKELIEKNVWLVLMCNRSSCFSQRDWNVQFKGELCWGFQCFLFQSGRKEVDTYKYFYVQVRNNWKCKKVTLEWDTQTKLTLDFSFGNHMAKRSSSWLFFFSAIVYDANEL